jgi:tRNA 2-thiocytidine biosynthesis protein TtcA
MSNRSLRLNPPGLVLQKLVTKAVLERGLIQDGDRVLIAVSGGKDSTMLAKTLSATRPALKRNFEMEALHISSDFCSCCKKAALAKNLESWGIPFEDMFVPIIGRLAPGREMNCYWCSTQRRMELLRFAVERGFNKIALGHHLDDIIETFFMNLMAGKMLAMPMLIKYRKFPVSIIRPLGLVEEATIISAAAEAGILAAACTCPFGRNSQRREVRKRLAAFAAPAEKRRILAALDTAGML